MKTLANNAYFCSVSGCVLAELIKGEALWPGKSDVDQLYVIRCTVGDLLPRHMQVFKTNDFFQGMALPVPQQMYPLEAILPMCDFVVLDFLKVPRLPTRYFEFLFVTLWKFQKCLDKDPAKRWTCEQLTRHKYFENFNFTVDENDQPNYDRTIQNRSSVCMKSRYHKRASIFCCITYSLPFDSNLLLF